MMTELINRIPGFSDMDMYQWCKKLQDACESTVVTKSKKTERMFETNEPVEERIRNSVKFYLEKMKKERLNLEITK